MRHVRMWHWLFLLSVFLVLGFVGAEHAETRAASLAQSAESRADSPVLLNETPESSSGWRMVGQVGGPTTAVAVQGNYAYVGVGLRLVVLDVSNPITPTEVGSTTPFPYFVEDVVVSGTLAYVAAGGAGLRVVNILTPTAPVEVGFWDSPGYAEGVAVAGSTVYLADGPYGLWTVDVSDPTQPDKVGSTYDMNYAFEVAVSGQHAYVAAAGAGLLVADVSDPAHPVEVSTLDTPGYAYGIAVSGTLAYVADAWEGLRIVDIANPDGPTQLGTYDTPGWALNVAIDGATAYIADGASGLRVVDISAPTDPRESGAYEVSGLARRVSAAGNLALVADLRAGLRVVDVTDPVHPVQAGLYSPLAEARRVAVYGNHAYVAAGFSGLRVVDISVPTHPREVTTYDTEGGYATGVVINGSHAYLATYIHGPYDLHVLDISDPVHPARVATLETPGTFRELVLQGHIIYAADEWGLRLIDVSNPAAPVELGFIQLNQNLQATTGVAVSGTLAYVADFLDGVKIVDVSNPISPTLVGIYDSPLASQGVAVADNHLFVADHGSGLRVVDVSNPGMPIEIGFYDTPGIAQSVTISGAAAYVSDSGGGLTVVDVSNPFSPTLVTIYNTAGLAWYTTLAGDYAYVADGHGGLVVLKKTTGDAVSRFKSRSTFPASRGMPDPVGLSESGIMTTNPATSRSANGTEAGPAVGTSVSTLPAGLLATTYIVTSVLDSGPGTLRQALLDAGPGDTITFDPAVFPPAMPMTIALESELPPVTQGYLTIDASNIGAVLDGSSLPANSTGLSIASDNNVVRGLQILYFRGVGIVVGGANNTIGGDRMQGTGPIGQGNLISGNQVGIHISGANNVVIGNLVGTDSSGTSAIPNTWHGIRLGNPATNNRVGGLHPGERNIISGNAMVGVEILEKGVVGNTVAGNYIGTDISGLHSLGNGAWGVAIYDGPSGNVVGGTEAGEGNLISGNGTGVVISGPDANHNTVIGNLIGTDASGTVALGNSFGISLCGAGYNRVEGNVISGNTGPGVAVCEWGWPHSLIRGNLIGTDVSGTKHLGNGTGIEVGGWHVLIGGAMASERNVIAASQGAGVDVVSAGTEYNWIAGNIIGTDASGTIPLGNKWAGASVTT